MSRGCHFDEGNQFITGVFDLDLGCDDEGGGGGSLSTPCRRIFQCRAREVVVDLSIYLSSYCCLVFFVHMYLLRNRLVLGPPSHVSRLPPPPLWIDGSSLLLGPWFQVVVDTPYVSTTDDDTHPLTRLLTMLFFVFRRSWCMLSFVVVAVVVGCG